MSQSYEIICDLLCISFHLKDNDGEESLQKADMAHFGLTPQIPPHRLFASIGNEVVSLH